MFRLKKIGDIDWDIFVVSFATGNTMSSLSIWHRLVVLYQAE